MLQSQTVWSGHPGQEEVPDFEVCGPARSRHFWSGRGVEPLADASENHDPNQAGRALLSNQAVAQHQGGESLDPQVD